MTGPTLPPGLTTRPLTRDDAHAVWQVMSRSEIEDLGQAQIEEADIVADWAKPSHDLSVRSIGVFEGDRLVAYGELMGADHADATVDPDWKGRGIGTWVATWLRDLGQRLGSSVVGMPVPAGSAGDKLLADLGWEVRWTSWILQLPRGARVPRRDLPEGFAVREAVEDDLPAVHSVLEDAFLEWAVRERESYEDFHAGLLGRPGFEPWNIRVVTDPGGEVVGVAVVLLAEPVEQDGVTTRTAYVDRLATRRDMRGRGIAQALLVDAFAQGAEHGADVCELSTDSRTGALGLYERVGMVVTSTWVNRAAQMV